MICHNMDIIFQYVIELDKKKKVKISSLKYFFYFILNTRTILVNPDNCIDDIG